MLKSHHQFFRLFFQITDGIVVSLSFWLAHYIRFYSHIALFPKAQEIIPFFDYSSLMVALIFIWFICLQVSGAYKSWRSSNIAREIFALIKASVLGFLVIVAGTHFLAREEFSRLVLILFLGLVIVDLSVSRLCLRLLLRTLRRRGWNQRHILLVGHPDLVALIDRKVRGRSELGYQIRGVIPVGENLSTDDLQSAFGTLDDLEAVIQREQVDQVVIALKNEDSSKLDRILAILMRLNVHTRIVPDITQYAILGFEVEEFDGVPIVTLNQSPLVGWNAVLKRISDIVYAGVALILFSPLMILLTALVRFTSRGPIFYTQERMGLDGKTFHMIKFRSMRVDAETQTGAVWAQKDDNRVTWIGAIMRKTSLDELPQLFNVLKGDMSCVGPRPERPVFVQQFRHNIPGYMLRHKVKSGMTGWAQVNGLRGNTSLEARIEHDLYYITHWSLLLDLKIMFMTIFKGFVSPHAY